MKLNSIIKRGSVVIAAAVSLAIMSSPAQAAAGIAPPDTPFFLSGGGNLVKNGNNGWVCNWIFQLQTDPSAGGFPPRASGGTIAGGSATGTNCSVMSMDPTTFSITSSNSSGGSGVFHGLRFKQGTTTFCSTSGNVPFTYLNNGSNPSSVQFNNASIGSGCVYIADLKTGLDLNVVP